MGSPVRKWNSVMIRSVQVNKSSMHSRYCRAVRYFATLLQSRRSWTRSIKK